ncbi:TolC family protein [Pelotomaculum propionicicum]|uniref:TolC family protein n=1 Tax=Pelotomaculum propionicicum TaxID=258475 RepID=UPI003B8105C7
MSKRLFPAILALLFLLAAFVPPAFSAEENGTLTLENAINMALKHNSDIKVQELNLDVTDEKLDDLRDSIDHIPAANVYVPEISSVWSGYLSAENSARIAKKALDNMKQQMAVDVMEQYYNILSSKRDVTLAETDLRAAQIKLAQARLKKQIGMITQAELLGVETAMQSAVASLTAAQNTLDQSYTQLAVMIGMSGSARPELVDEAVLEKANFISLEAVTASALSRNYTVWAAERTAALAERVEMYADNYDLGLLNTDIKEIQASDAREQLKEQVKILYQSLQTLEETNATLEQKAATLEETLRVTKLMHEVGMATALQELEAEQSYNEALDELRQLVYEYDLAKSQLMVLTGEDILTENTI